MGTRQRRDREAKRRRQSILDAARDVFFKHGYAAATIPKVAAAAELAPGTLYLYFPSKDALYAELLAEGYETLHQRLAQSVRPGAPPRRQAEALIDAFFDFARQNPEYFDIVFFVLQREGATALDAWTPRKSSAFRPRNAGAKRWPIKCFAASAPATPGVTAPPWTRCGACWPA